jgi:hypothetical protein
MPDKDGNETPAERKKREKQERIDLVNDQEIKRRNKARQEKAWEDALAEADDDFLAEEFERMTGMSTRAAEDYLDIAWKKDSDDKDVQEAAEAIRRAKKAAEGGIFTSGDKKKARKILRSKEKQIKNAVKKGKQGKGCIYIALVMFAGLAAILYGAYEGVSTLASAIF